MKKTLLTTLFTFACLFAFVSPTQAQDNFKEPDFIGEVVLIKNGVDEGLLEKSPVQVKSSSGAAMYITGIGSVKTRMIVKGCCANIRITTADEVQFIVKAVDNQTDPISIIRVIEFDKKKKERRAELASVHSFAGTSSNNMKLVTFSAKKFGESSYIIKVSGLQPGEYGIYATNPNALDEKMTVVSCFGVDAAAEVVATEVTAE